MAGFDETEATDNLRRIHQTTIFDKSYVTHEATSDCLLHGSPRFRGRVAQLRVLT